MLGTYHRCHRWRRMVQREVKNKTEKSAARTIVARWMSIIQYNFVWLCAAHIVCAGMKDNNPLSIERMRRQFLSHKTKLCWPHIDFIAIQMVCRPSRCCCCVALRATPVNSSTRPLPINAGDRFLHSSTAERLSDAEKFSAFRLSVRDRPKCVDYGNELECHVHLE